MDEIYMVEAQEHKNKMPLSMHGAFRSFRGASEWLINEGFDVFFDDEASEFFEEESLSFERFEAPYQPAATARIVTFSIHD